MSARTHVPSRYLNDSHRDVEELDDALLRFDSFYFSSGSRRFFSTRVNDISHTLRNEDGRRAWIVVRTSDAHPRFGRIHRIVICRFDLHLGYVTAAATSPEEHFTPSAARKAFTSAVQSVVNGDLRAACAAGRIAPEYILQAGDAL